MSATTHTDGGMLAIGEQCEHPSCMLVDFLPFKCTHCSHKYCLEHFQPDAHSCAQYDPSAGDRIAPNCPFCSVPIAYAKGTDPNVRMERHFDTECAVLVDEEKRRRAQTKMPVCRARGCSKKLVQPIQCQACRQKYCAEHRYASDHACSGPSTNTSSSTFTTTSKSTLAGGRPSQNAPGAQAALAALKRNIAAAKTAATKPAATPTSKPPARTATAPAPRPAPKVATMPATASSSSGPAPPQPAPKAKVPNPFSKTDRRARAEAESRRKALRDRERKGLLTDADKARLAEMDRQAEEADKETCIIS